jgi:1-acyl-sn-glycerol-3-phosphate acyltransferase
VRVVGALLVATVRLLVGAHARWAGRRPDGQAIYFANHTSHIDTVAIWSALDPHARRMTRPVAARDYWSKGPVRRYLACNVLNAVLIERHTDGREADPLEPLVQALEAGQSLILFPEGTRGAEPLPGPFKSGIYRLAQRFPAVQLVPVYLENLNRAMPKGTWLPVPLTCSVRFGAPLPRQAEEAKEAFVERARAAVVALA